MPPQQEDTQAVGDEAGAMPNKEDTTDNGEGGASYWDAPKERSLEGKTLSTLDMSMLEKANPDKDKEKNDSYWEATPERGLDGKTLSTMDMAVFGAADKTTNGEDVKTSPSKSLPKTPICAEEPDTEPSYWDVPKERSLEGKTLSTLDMSMLEKVNPDKNKGKNDSYWEATPERGLEGKTLSTLDMSLMEANNPEEQQKKKDSYWDAAPVDRSLQGKTLSKLELSALESNHPDEKKEKNDSYWDAPEERKLQGKTLSTININTLETESTGEEPSSETAPSYWDDAPIERSLQGKTLSQIDMSAMSKQHAGERSSKSGDHPYWDWKMKGFKKTLSKLSLSNLRTGSRKDEIMVDDDFCVHGANNSRTNSMNSLDSSGVSNDGPRQPVKPITKKTHKLRDSWRKSFQKMSTNTLDLLDESTSSGGRIMGSRIFKSRNNLDVSGGSRSSVSSTGSDGGITF
ncbi:unnamed protein product [Pseudo-nitzschia multistriata]|uniref:Uncharacterized protein n=1 Tax=Pseudo-nitzschia multistriata TaxID=183589 RepID=A0A448Z8L5_9STRA|nr:unnamed protein product [Pseudo-nitzschia multistriata]